MKYEKMKKATFLERPNRFIAKVLVEENGQTVETTAHVKNTGRCKELLPSGAMVYLEDFQGRMGSRKMRYSLINVEKEVGDRKLLINMDSQAPNKVVMEGLKAGKITLEGMGPLVEIKAEKTFRDSRFDFYVKDNEGKEGFIEVKGVTLEENGICRFPDAPTERGTKHIEHLIKAKDEGYLAMVLFVIQMKGMKCLMPNWHTDESFAKALCRGDQKGVEIKAMDCKVAFDSLEIDEFVPVYLKDELMPQENCSI